MPQNHDLSTAEARRTSGRVLVFIVAYEAERHVRSVFERIPRELYNNDRVHFLLIDDASSDASVRVAREWMEENSIENVTLLRNPVNQGYGGNQKLGYRIGIDAAFDFIILLHGDGQYAPEMLPKFIQTWEETGADVVLGSRMTDIKSARAGGMPWYKVAANKFLTTVQNKLTGQALSEYHTGYRGYSTHFLKQVPFEIDTNDFHFDTEILLQAFHVGAKIEQFAIPTHYGDEVCRVNGPQYGKNVLAATLRYRMHRMGMLCDLKFRNLTPARYQDKTFMLYSSHAIALDILRKSKPATLLDIGCGPGFIAKRCEDMNIRVTGLDYFEPMPAMMSEFHRLDLESKAMPVDPFAYDAVLLLDVIEHIADPENFLVDLRNRSKSLTAMRKPPLLILSTPNIAFAAIRLNMLLGRFNYAERGILDITHKRLFTRSSLVTMLRDCGYKVESVRPVAVPFQTVVGGTLGKLLGQCAGALARLWPTMFGFQFLVTCRPLPGVKQVLSQSEKHLRGDEMIAASTLEQAHATV